MRKLQKVKKKTFEKEKKIWIELTERRVECDIHYKTKAGAPTKKHARHIAVHEDALKEVMIVLRAMSLSVLRDIKRRFVKTGVLADILQVYNPAYDMSRLGVPDCALNPADSPLCPPL